MKDKLKSIFAYLAQPPAFVSVTAIVLAVIFSGGSIVALALDLMSGAFAPLAYVLFALAAITLAYAVYLIVRFAPRAKDSLTELLNSNTITRSLVKNYSFRTVVFAAGGFFISLAFGIFNGVLGIIAHSVWYGALAVYHIIIAVIRGRTVFSHIKTSDDSERGELFRAANYRNTGIQLFVLNLALSSAIAQMIFDDRFFDYPDWTVFAYAAYAFYKITMSIVNIFRSRRQDDYTVHAIRDINLVAAMVSLLALQTALLHTFGTGEVDVSLLNTMTGSVVSISSVALSVFMIVKGSKKIKEIKNDG